MQLSANYVEQVRRQDDDVDDDDDDYFDDTLFEYMYNFSRTKNLLLLDINFCQDFLIFSSFT